MKTLPDNAVSTALASREITHNRYTGLSSGQQNLFKMSVAFEAVR
jgi:hypothetical protein